MIKSAALNSFLYGLVLIISCSKKPETDNTPLSSNKTIQSFIFLKTDNSFLPTDIGGTISQDTINVVFPNGTSLNSLAPTIVISGASVDPANKVAQNFNVLKTYTVTAEDRSTKNYYVSCKVAQSDQKNIVSFIFTRANNPQLSADINATIVNDSLIAVVPFGTNITSLKPSILITGISVSPSSLSPQNFSSTVQYVVTAENGSTKSYKAVITIEPGPQFGPETLYIGSAYGAPIGGVGKLYALDLNTGNVKWTYTPVSGSIVPGIDFANSNLYFGIGNKIIAFDTITRAIKWEYTAGGAFYSTPVVVNGIVYINCDDYYLYAIDAVTGILKWRFLQELGSTGGNYSSPTVFNNVVYFASLAKYVYAVNAVTGTLIWKKNFPFGGEFQSSPSVVNGVLYIGDNFHSLLALDIANGNTLWVNATFVSSVFSSPSVVNNTVYVGCADGNLHAIDVTTGTNRWVYGTGAAISGSPTVSNGVVYVGNEVPSQSSYLYAIDAVTGTLKWMYRSDFTIFASPTVYNNIVYMASYNTVSAINTANGALKWKFTTNTPVNEQFRAGPCIVDANGNVYVSGVSGRHN